GVQTCALPISLFFISTLLAFYAAGRAGVDVGFAYYVWVGAFGVLMPAQLWAHAASTYPPESGQRLFPLIMVGAAVGSLAGPKLASGLHSTLGAWNLMVLGAVLLTALLPLLERRDSSASPAAGDGPETRPRTSLLGGFALVLRDRYLLLLAAVAVLLNCVNSLGEFIL